MTEQFIIRMYDDGVSLEQLTKAFKKTTREIINIVWSAKCQKNN